MSLRINHNTSALNSHRNLAANQMKMGKTLEKLSSGLRINRASDDAARRGDHAQLHRLALDDPGGHSERSGISFACHQR